jgi:hypothetical protein
MASDVFSFLWRAPEDGYRWMQVRVFVNDAGDSPGAFTHGSRLEDKPEWVLTDGIAFGQTCFFKQYSPLKLFTGLFRTFAGLPWESQDAILAFANEYGHLGIGRPLDVTAKDDPQRLLGVWGETWQDWAKEIDAMRRAVAIWDMVEARDEAGLSQSIRWEAGGEKKVHPNYPPVQVAQGWRYDSHPALPPVYLDRRGVPPFPAPGRLQQMILPVPGLFRADDVITPASFMVQRWINEHLKEHAAPSVVYDLDLQKRVIQIIPDSLLSAMWLQFAQAVEGNKDYRSCKECGRWFELSSRQADHRTKRREFCSDPCKSRDYRKRKELAAKMPRAKPTVTKKRALGKDP